MSIRIVVVLCSVAVLNHINRGLAFVLFLIILFHNNKKIKIMPTVFVNGNENVHLQLKVENYCEKTTTRLFKF